MNASFFPRRYLLTKKSKSFRMSDTLWILTAVAGGGLGIGFYFLIRYVKEYCYLNKITTYFDNTIIASNFRECVRAVLKLLDRRHLAYRVIGMDCEFMSSSKNGGHPVPAILQLASPDGYCAIIQLNVIMEKIKNIPCNSSHPVFLPPLGNVLTGILKDPTILKVGVGVLEDARYIDESYGVLTYGCLDIRHMARLAGFQPGGLGRLANEVLGKEKVKIIKKPPWEKQKLSEVQISYAAQDARLGVEIFLRLNEIVMERKYSWLRRIFWDEKKYWKYTLKCWKHLIGMPFKLNKEKFSTTTWITKLPRTMTEYARFFGKYTHFIFESAFANRECIVCGIPDHALMSVVRKAMVPVDYNVTFDDEELYYIDLCQECLKESNKLSYELREELTEECGAPHPDYKNNQLETAKKIALELITSGKTNNEWVFLQEDMLHKLFPDMPYRCLNLKTMEIILSMDCWPGSAHGEFVYKYFKQFRGGEEELRWLWCERFMNIMKPMHLTMAWKRFYRGNTNWNRKLP